MTAKADSSSLSLPGGTAEPWGHKLIAHIYVAGDISQAVDASDVVCDLDLPGVDLIGVTIEEIPEKPKEQGS